MFTLSKWISGLLMLSLLTGCMVGPDFKSPETKLPQAWIGPTSAPSTQQSVVTAQSAEIAHWWTVLNDPELDSLVARAVESNLDLKTATARIRQARASRIISRSGLWPSVDTSAAYTRTGSGSDSRELYRAGLDATWEIDVFGGNRRNLEASDADLLASIENRRDTLISLAAEVALTYIDLRGSQRQIEVAFENLDAQKRTAGITRQKAEAGFVGKLDSANAEASVAATATQIPVLESQIRQSIYSLSVLLGKQPTELLDEMSKAAPIPKVPGAIPAGMPSDLLRRRPDIRSAEARLHAATASVGSAEADLFPKFSLTGAFSESSGAPKRLPRWDNGVWSIGPTVSWPLFDAGRIRANIEIQNALQEESLIAYEQTVLLALQDVENAMIAFEKEQQHHELLLVAVDANRRAVDLATTLYQQGLTDSLNLITAQRALFASQSSLAQSDQTIATNLVSLYKALGGGWEDEAQPTTAPTTRE